jgi:hypothetical protein
MSEKKKKHAEQRAADGQEAAPGQQDPLKGPIEDTEKIKADLA